MAHMISKVCSKSGLVKKILLATPTAQDAISVARMDGYLKGFSEGVAHSRKWPWPSPHHPDSGYEVVPKQ